MRSAVFSLVGFLLAAPALGQELPARPALPEQIAFADELAARKALYAARDAAVGPQGYRFACQWTILRQGNGPRVSSQTGTETLYAAPGSKLAVRWETGSAGNRIIRGFFSDGDSVLVTRFDERNKQASRSFSQFALAETGTLERALRESDCAPLGLTRGFWLATQARFPVTNRLWRGANGAVLEAESLTPSERRPSHVWRYRFHPETHALIQVEEWETRDRRTTYRKETYTTAPRVAKPFALDIPANYTEKRLLIVARPTKLPSEFDARAKDLLARWERAHERLFTLNTHAEVASREDKRTAESGDRNGGRGRRRPPFQATYVVWLQKTARAQIAIEGVDDQPPSQTISANGTQLKLEQDGRSPRTMPLDDPTRWEQALQRYAAGNALDPLQWVLQGPPALDGFDRVASRGPLTLADGTFTEVVEFASIQRSRSGDNRAVVDTQTIQIALGADFLPRRIEWTRKTDIDGLFERDQPPVWTMVIELTELQRDREPPF